MDSLLPLPRFSFLRKGRWIIVTSSFLCPVPQWLYLSLPTRAFCRGPGGWLPILQQLALRQRLLVVKEPAVMPMHGGLVRAKLRPPWVDEITGCRLPMDPVDLIKQRVDSIMSREGLA